MQNPKLVSILFLAKFEMRIGIFLILGKRTFVGLTIMNYKKKKAESKINETGS